MKLLCLLAIAGACTFALGCRYDSSPLMFNPAGRVLQVENAVAAVKKKGLPVVGVVFSDGLLLVTKDRADSGKQSAHSSKKFIIVDEHCCIAPSGFAADGVSLGKAAKTLAAKHKKEFGRNIPIEVLSDQLADWMHLQTRRGSTRPLGLSALVAGADDELGFQMYSLEPQGAYQGWKAVCVGGMHCDRNHAILQGALTSTDELPVLGEFWNRLVAEGGELLASLFASGPATFGNAETDNKGDEAVQVFTISRSQDNEGCPWATRVQRLSIKALPPALF